MHVSVLKEEVVELLDPQPGQNFIDATVNGGGHAKAILEKTAPNGKLLAIDLDGGVLEKFKQKAEQENLSKRIIFANDNFKNIRNIVKRERLVDVDGIVADLGFSSWQLEESGRGFSFQKDEPLLMTLSDDPDALTANDLVNGLGEDDLVGIIRDYGEERFARLIAKAIISARRKQKIERTCQLKEIIEKAVGHRYSGQKINPATRTFQALRIATNKELENLREFLEGAFGVLSDGGKLAIVSFHSLEDRIVKNFFRDRYKEKEALLLTKKPIVPTREEILNNPKSRSAKLRVLEKKL